MHVVDADVENTRVLQGEPQCRRRIERVGEDLLEPERTRRAFVDTRWDVDGRSAGAGVVAVVAG